MALDWCLLHGLRANNSLVELRFIGMLLDATCLRALCIALKSGLTALKLLEFSIDGENAEAEAASSDILNVAKDRAYTGRSGVSVTVNSSANSK